MKILTLNASAYCGDNPIKNMANLTEVIAKNDYDIIALQEVNQEMQAKEIPISELDNYIPCQDRVPLKEDNYVYQICKALSMSGINYYFSWLPVHVGWGHFDEGLAILSKHRIIKTNAFYVSKETDYWNVFTRMALGIQTDFNGKKEWYYSVHFDKWNNPTSPFDIEWDNFTNKATNTPYPLYVMGDFNNDGNVRGEAIDYVLKTSNLFDTYDKAEYKDNGITVDDYIAGWVDTDHPKQMRIDFIFSNTDLPVLSSHIVFNGANEPVVSDHFGLEVSFGNTKNKYKIDPNKTIPEFSSEVQTTSPPVPTNSGFLTIYNPIFRRKNQIMLEDLLAILNETLDWFDSLDD